MKRWPDLKVLKPRALEIARAKGGNQHNVDNYFAELENILNKYNMKDKPHLIYNADEKGMQTEHSPPNVVGDADFHPPAVTSGKGSTITIIGYGNAAGNSIPPYFIFPGMKMQNKWMEGCSPGAVGTVSESGWSNGQIFMDFLKYHFLKFVPGRNEKVLLLVDGHKSHVSLNVIEWAQQHNIIIHILPAHTSHFLQPLDVGIYGPFQKIYNNLVHKKTRQMATVVTKDEVCPLAYNKAFTPENLQSAFKKTGLFPFNRNIIDNKVFAPSEVFNRDDSVNAECTRLGDAPLEGVESEEREVEAERGEEIEAERGEEVEAERGEEVEAERGEEVDSERKGEMDVDDFFNSRIDAVKRVKS